MNDPLDCSEIMYDRPLDWQSQHKTLASKQELKRRAQALTDGQKEPFARKYDFALRVIDKALTIPDINWSLSYSGGRDSTVLSYILINVFKLQIPHLTSNTRLEYPETIRQIYYWKKHVLNPNDVKLHMAYPDIRPQALWNKVGLPIWSKQISSKYRQYFKTSNVRHKHAVRKNLQEKFDVLKSHNIKVSDECCNHLKKYPLYKLQRKLDINGIFTGIRCAESQNRRLTYIQYGAMYFNNKKMWIVNPLSHWTEVDIQLFITKHNIQINDSQNGCVCCMFGCHTRQQRIHGNALQKLKCTNKKMYNIVLNDWGYKRVLDILEIPYE